jgi:hypothetical protein
MTSNNKNGEGNEDSSIKKTETMKNTGEDPDMANLRGNRQSKPTEQNKATKKILYAGEFYKKATTTDKNQKKSKWIRTGNNTRDFTTLIR